MKGRAGIARSRVGWALALAVAVTAWQAQAALAADSVYWSDYGNGLIRVGPIYGSGAATTVFASEHGPFGVGLNPATGRLYWTSFNDGGIRVGSLDGSGIPADLFTGEAGPASIDVDAARGKLYWADQGGSIRAANLGGTGARSLFTGEDKPSGVAIDPAAGKIYWSTQAGAIRVGNLDGRGSASNLFTNEASPNGVAIDPGADKIYWASFGGTRIRAGNLNGSGHPSTLFASEVAPVGVAIDPAAGKIYWASEATPNGAIRVGNLDGRGTASTLFTTENYPNYPVILRAPVGARRPRVAGGRGPGATLACSQGVWANDVPGASLYRAPRSYAYRWARNGADIAGAAASTYTASSSGSYTCRVTATNGAGSSTQTSSPHAVGAPNTRIIGAAVSSRKRRVTLEFKAIGRATGFQCELKRTHHRRPEARFRACESPKRYRHVKPGRYTFEVRAVRNRLKDPTPARKRFRIKP